MTSIQECYDKVLAQSKSITEHMLEGQYVDEKHVYIKTWSSNLDSITVVLNTTNTTKDIGNRII